MDELINGLIHGLNSDLDPLEQPLHESLLRGLGAQARPELGHVLYDRCGGNTSEHQNIGTSALSHRSQAAAAADTDQMSRAETHLKHRVDTSSDSDLIRWTGYRQGSTEANQTQSSLHVIIELECISTLSFRYRSICFIVL